jgi:moderate conductance mechanosensitive channel
MIWLTTTTPPECEREDWLCRSVLDATGNDWLAAAADWLIAKPAVIAFIVAIAWIARWLVYKAIARLVRRAAVGVVPPVGHGALSDADESAKLTARVARERRRQRAETLGQVLRSVASFTIFTFAAVMVLSELGVNVGPLIAGAGIVGVALGFGAQSLVSDFLSGLFMLFEDQYGVGDVVDVGDATGTVEAVTLRVTRLRDVNGTVWYVRNGEIMRVGNMSQNWARAVLDVKVGYGEDLDRVRRVLGELFHDLWLHPSFRETVMEEPQVWGVERIDPDGIVVRVALKTVPLEQWAVARDLRQKIREKLRSEGIEMPLPQRVVWHRDQQGAAPVGGQTAGGAAAD